MGVLVGIYQTHPFFVHVSYYGFIKRTWSKELQCIPWACSKTEACCNFLLPWQHQALWKPFREVIVSSYFWQTLQRRDFTKFFQLQLLTNLHSYRLKDCTTTTCFYLFFFFLWISYFLYVWQCKRASTTLLFLLWWLCFDINLSFSFNLICYLAAPWPIVGHYWGDSHTHLMLTTALFSFDSKVTWSLGLAKHLVDFELGTF